MSSDFERFERELARELRWRRRACRVLTLGRHLWEPWHPIEVRALDGLTDDELVNDVGFEELGQIRQCRICYTCETR